MTTTRTVANPYLDGFLAPVRAEVTAFDLPVTGRIPDHLDGRYLRNGPNPVAEVDPATYHWFSGDGMVHGVALRDGRARWYRNRWVRTAHVCAALGEPAPGGLDPRAGMLSVGPNTDVLSHAGQTLALVEGGGANYRLTEDLDTVGTCDFDGTLFGGYTAHPHRDPRTGELHAVSYSFGRGRRVQYSVIDTAGRARRTVDIEVSGSPMMHDFSLTDEYVVIYDLPVTFDPVQVMPADVPRWLSAPARLVVQSLLGRVQLPGPMATAMNRNRQPLHRMPYRWNDAYPARLGVMPRDGGNDEVRWFDIEPCYVYHPLNAYSEIRDGAKVLVLDVVRYSRMFDRDLRGPGDTRPTLDRWTVNLATGAVGSELRDDRPQEFPRINEALLGRRHRFGYTVGTDGGYLSDGASEMSTGLYKHDYATGSRRVAPLDPDLLIGEMCFVPNPAGGQDGTEDDGILMGFGYHRGRDENQLVLLDAQSLEQVAAVHLPQRVPMGFHGNWVPAG
ncbi:MULTISPECIES: carotenoid oxygenase family protein [Mycobacterium avium complex (MAC)]|uniref:Dioxygenase n=2 Tax=Mycobacterium avium TaxID=1764 RepID=A0A3B6X4J6_MYCAV|nr:MULTISPECIES: carotenoid oxygenase family protein [Mycobacterium avium complex (MAC)]AXO21829.1 carotenoid oxygenase [Mycobacterium avium subsp. hominissuis]ETZ64657.1 retinal pigment epithelial membrane family protein [Mycobacterium sp. MAC_080597_8934]ETZ76010.1 retinal pigment epithelial membrane family protein [Mycobacterium sp. MAC_011194_8550]PBA24521.1 carotenoid oxygenase [Mycobacterium avium]PBA69868.1 carotenoid oxygenase [Mycobacterium avium]